jgi:hypothetical protein
VKLPENVGIRKWEHLVKLPQNVGIRKWNSKVHTKHLVNNFLNVGPNENYIHLILFLTLKPIEVYIKNFKLGVLGPHPTPRHPQPQFCQNCGQNLKIGMKTVHEKRGGTQLVFSPKFVLKGISSPVWD